MVEMKTLTIGGTTYEVVDAQAREDIEALKTSGGGVTPVFEVDEVVTLNAGEQATVDIDNADPANPRISFGIPKGADGENGKDGNPGADGKDGTNGEDGVGIASVTQTTTSTADGGENVITVTLTNGNKSTFTVKNGSKGNTGETGATGADGKDGTNGKDGADGEDGVGIKSIAKTSTSGLVDTYTITFTDNTTTTFTVTNGEDGAGEAETVNICLPSSDVAVVGKEYNLYKDAVIFGNRPYDEYDIAIYLNDSSVSVYNYHEVFRFTPSAAGTYTLTVYVRDFLGTTLATKTMTLDVIENSETSGKKVLFIGDSLTAAGIYTAEIQHNLSAGGIVSVGTIETTRTIDSESLTSVHEGRNGWATWDYAGTNTSSLSKFNSDSNVFRNPDTNLFDLDYYMNTHHSGVTLHAVCINLGTNGIGADTSVMNGLNEMVTRIREYDSTLPILIHLTIPEARQDYRAHLANGGKNTTHEHMRRCWRSQVNAYMTAYDGVVDNVYVVPVYRNMDILYDFPTEEVAVSTRNPTTIQRASDGHPNTYGYLKMADVYYAHLLKYMREGGETADTYYTVTNNLTSATNSNTATSVKAGDSYTATLTANSGYVLDTVTVTMGGTAVTVTDGAINIASVTGNIVITATAVEDSGEPTVVSLVDPTTANDLSPDTVTWYKDEWINGYYISSSSLSAKTGCITTDLFPIAKGQKIKIEGILCSSSEHRTRIRWKFFNSSGTAVYSSYVNFLTTEVAGGDAGESSYDADTNTVIVDTSGLVNAFDDMAYARFSCYPAGANEELIVSVVE